MCLSLTGQPQSEYTFHRVLFPWLVAVIVGLAALFVLQEQQLGQRVDRLDRRLTVALAMLREGLNEGAAGLWQAPWIRH